MPKRREALQAHVPPPVAQKVRERADEAQLSVSSWLYLQIRDAVKENREPQKTAQHAA
jgi:hypothetical protein